MAKRYVAALEKDGVRLRLLEAGDLQMTWAWRNQARIRRWFFYSDVISWEMHTSWYDKYKTRDDDFVFIIAETRTLKKPVGQVALYDIDWTQKRGEYGRLMLGEPDAQGRGIARTATNLLLGQAFVNWGLSEVYLEVYATNTAALAVYDACGFCVASQTADVLRMIKRPGLA